MSPPVVIYLSGSAPAQQFAKPPFRAGWRKEKGTIMLHRKLTMILPAMLLTLAAVVMAADSDANILNKSGSLERLLKKSGVYNTSPGGRTPGFVVDPSWP